MDLVRSSEEDSPFYLGQRLSYEGALCTVRYRGALPGTKGSWLGVEWDGVDRGKHDAGSFIRPSRTHDLPRSFLDALRFKYAAEETKEDPFGTSKAIAGAFVPSGSVIEISGKVVEEIGFERIRQQQAELQNLRIALLDGLRLSGVTRERHDPGAVAASQEAVTQTCPQLVELDLGWNLLETWTDIAEICLPLQKLRVLKASGLRLREFDLLDELDKKQPFYHVTELHLNENLMQPEQIATLFRSLISGLSRFPELKVVSLSHNRLSHLQMPSQYQLNLQLPRVTTLILDNNMFTSLAFLPDVLKAFPGLKTLSLQGNQISSIGLSPDQGSDEEVAPFPQIESLNLSHNLIKEFSFVDHLPQLFPSLKSLRVSNNPFFTSLANTNPPVHDEFPSRATESSRSSSVLPGPLSLPPRASRTDAAYSLTLARIPTLASLNHSTVAPRDREEGEIYYISVAERELSAALAMTTSSTQSRELGINEWKKRYPRYEELCRMYDRDSIFDTQVASSRQPTAKEGNMHRAHAAGTLGARLIKATFYVAPSVTPTGAAFTQTAMSTASEPSRTERATFSRLIPRTISVYSLKALIARTFDLPALKFRLVYESRELDPLVTPRGSNEKVTWETWGDWDLDHPPREGAENEGKRWKRREVEILDGTREWGFYLEDGISDVKIRIEAFMTPDTGPRTGRKS